MSPFALIVGLGGSGGWAAQTLSKSDGSGKRVLLADGDVWEKKNLDRCLAGQLDVGQPKVKTAARKLRAAGYEVAQIPRYLAPGTDDWRALLDAEGPMRLLCFVDNHAARRACLRLADLRAERGTAGAGGDVVVVAGNEYETCSADAYLPAWRGTKLDPRVRYPEIETGTEGDPLAPPCTGEAAASSPQLAEANGLSALAALWLMRVWSEREPARRGSEFHGAIVDRMPVSIQYGSVAAKTLTKKEVEDAP